MPAHPSHAWGLHRRERRERIARSTVLQPPVRLAVVCSISAHDESRREALDQTTESIATAERYVWIPVFNDLAPSPNPFDLSDLSDLYQWRFTQPPEQTVILQGRRPPGVAKAWNDGILRARSLGCAFALVIEEDVVFQRDEIDHLLRFACACPDAILWSMGSDRELSRPERASQYPEHTDTHPAFSSFLVRPAQWFSQFGLFDENFVPGFYAAGDAHARIALSHKRAYGYEGAQPFHAAPQAVARDGERRAAMQPPLAESADYFRWKWGSDVLGHPDEIRTHYYSHPYNEDDKPLFYWRKIL